MHTSAEFKVQHLGFAWVKGTIYGISGEIQFEPGKIAEAAFNGKLDVSTLTTGNEQRDGHLKGADFFDLENYPEIKFSTKSVEETSENSAKVTGDLTIKDTTKEVELDVKFNGTGTKMGNEGETLTVASFSITSKLNRYDFGLTWNVELPGGKLLVGKDVELSIEVEAIQE